MRIINLIFGVPLGILMKGCYALFSDYGIALILFTALTKVIMFPLSLAAQKNSIKMVRMKPQLDEIKSRYRDTPELILSEQKKLYKKEKYSSFMGLLPLLIQIPIILGLINVVYNPLTHLFSQNAAAVSALSERATELTGQIFSGSGSQIEILRLISERGAAFADMLSPATLVSMQNLDFFFLGFDLAKIPTMAGLAVLIPILSGLSSLLLSALQNRYNVLQREQGALGKWGMALFLVAFSTYFAFIVPGGIGLYWIAGNLLSIPVLFLCNIIYNPAKYIDYENRSIKPKLTKEEKKALSAQKKAAKARQKADVKRFFSRDKGLVFYSESSGFYKYFSSIIDYLLKNSDIEIHYVTSDAKDRIFQNLEERIHKYYVGGNKLISFMMRMDADIVVMTMPDLDKYHIKRSIVRKDTEYIYLDHGMTSYHLMLRENALDAFDTIFVYGPNHIAEVRETEKHYKLPPKNLVKTGYALLDDLLASVRALPQTENNPPRVLIGPSWQKDNLMEYCLDELLAQLLRRDFVVILRPHPEFVKRFPNKMNDIFKKYADDIGENFIIETDFSSNETVYSSDVIVTDWSSIAQEFSYATLRPSLFLNTPMKIMNQNYKNIPLVPLDISLRDEIGLSLNVEEFDRIPGIIADFFQNRTYWKDKIARVLEDNIYHIGNAAQVSGDYLLKRLAEIEAERKKALAFADFTAPLSDEDTPKATGSENAPEEEVLKGQMTLF